MSPVTSSAHVATGGTTSSLVTLPSYGRTKGAHADTLTVKGAGPAQFEPVVHTRRGLRLRLVRSRSPSAFA